MGLGKKYLAVHAHFYQPIREDPFTGQVPQELGAEPYHDFNEKINAECYKPNAEAGNFRQISFDVGPTLAMWLERSDRRTHDLIVDSDREHRRRFGVGNAIAQAYNHTILPLATTREKRTQIAWGIAEFAHRFGRKPEGLWLAETAVDHESLEIMAEMGVQFTILAPWQAAGHADTGQPYRVRLRNGRSIVVFFYNSALSGAVSFDSHATICAESFSAQLLTQHLDHQKMASDEPQIILVATDGEVYGHHKPGRDQFLAHLLTYGAPQQGFEVVSLTRYLQLHPPRWEIAIEEDTSWSCHHGVKRWRDSCGCTDGNGSWKWHLRRALGRLAARVDTVYELQTTNTLRDPWEALEQYIDVKLGAVSWREFLSQHRIQGVTNRESSRVLRLLEAQYYRQLMFTSCAFFFEDLDRIEPRINITMAARVIALLGDTGVINLMNAFLDDLGPGKSWRTGRTAVEIYKEVISRHRPRRRCVAVGGRLTAA
ncbi:MAG: DUF3536 domain-containing protein [Chloroflexi bacterium]|nr:DUF3536 domain-containing protein [Chloroflexota bacterium]